MAGHTRRTVSEYGSALPDGVFLRHLPHNHRYQLMLGEERLGKPRPDRTVLSWTNPERVFRSIARREMGQRP